MARTLRERVEAARPHVRMLSLAEAKALIDAGNVTVIDVGEAWQLVERGTIAGARNIARGEFEIPADSELPRRDLRLQGSGAEDHSHLWRRRQGNACGQRPDGDRLHERLSDQGRLRGLEGSGLSAGQTRARRSWIRRLASRHSADYGPPPWRNSHRRILPISMSASMHRSPASTAGANARR
jgi:hypothetical protein